VLDLSRALQVILYPIGNFLLFLLRTISLSGTTYSQHDAGHYLIHIITGFIINIVISITQPITDLLLIIIIIC
jgi:hypothetical protein